MNLKNDDSRRMSDLIMDDSTSSVKETQFWSPELRVEFIKQIHKHGRQWQMVHKEILVKTPEQCRSHAQKHFNNWRNLKESLEKCKGDQSKLTEEIHIKIQQYEDECRKVMEAETKCLNLEK